jgi:hypothetical protein
MQLGNNTLVSDHSSYGTGVKEPSSKTTNCRKKSIIPITGSNKKHSAKIIFLLTTTDQKQAHKENREFYYQHRHRQKAFDKEFSTNDNRRIRIKVQSRQKLKTIFPKWAQQDAAPPIPQVPNRCHQSMLLRTDDNEPCTPRLPTA